MLGAGNCIVSLAMLYLRIWVLSSTVVISRILIMTGTFSFARSLYDIFWVTTKCQPHDRHVRMCDSWRMWHVWHHHSLCVWGCVVQLDTVKAWWLSVEIYYKNMWLFSFWGHMLSFLVCILQLSWGLASTLIQLCEFLTCEQWAR